MELPRASRSLRVDQSPVARAASSRRRRRADSKRCTRQTDLLCLGRCPVNRKGLDGFLECPGHASGGGRWRSNLPTLIELRHSGRGTRTHDLRRDRNGGRLNPAWSQELQRPTKHEDAGRPILILRRSRVFWRRARGDVKARSLADVAQRSTIYRGREGIRLGREGIESPCCRRKDSHANLALDCHHHRRCAARPWVLRARTPL
jgi:hypothetical protein